MILLDHFLSRLRRRWFLWHGANIGRNCRFEPLVSIQLGYAKARRGSVRVGNDTILCQGTCLHAWGGTVTIGSHVFVGPYAVVYGHGGVDIGDCTLISMHCRIVSSNHTIPPPGVDIRSQPDVLRPTKIGRDVWLGAGVTVLGGVTIGDGAIVGAGAVVTHDLPANSIAHGIPAQVVGARQ